MHRDCNEVRPHSSLKGGTPKEYAEAAAGLLIPGATDLGGRVIIGLMSILNYGSLIDPVLRDLRRFAVEFSGVKSGDRVIDVCCGTGAQVLEFARRGVAATGLDISEAMLKIATRNKMKEGASNVSFQLGDASDLLFPDDYFDCAMVTFGLHDKEKAVRHRIVSEMVRTVKEGGNLILIDFQVPLPRNKWALIAKVVEFSVGGSHYRGFREYLESGGLEAILKVYGLREVNRAYPLSGLVTAVKLSND